MKRKWNISFIILLILTLMIIVFQIKPVMADIPAQGITAHFSVGSDTILNITIIHNSPTFSHYVDKMEVKINGDVQSVAIDFSDDRIVEGSQFGISTFTFQYNLGEVIGTPTVQVRTNCNLHGWSFSWSNTVEIPEFSFLFLILAIVLLSITFNVLNSRFMDLRRKI